MSTAAVEPRPSLRRVLAWALLMLALGVVCALVWQALARPSEFTVTERGAVLGESASRGQFGVVVLFVGLGMAASLLWGAVAARVLRGLGWMLVPLTVVVCALASVIAWRLGVALGPPDPASVGGDLQLGDTIPNRLAVDSVAAFLMWPVLGLVGVLVSTYLTREPDQVLEARPDGAPAP